VSVDESGKNDIVTPNLGRFDPDDVAVFDDHPPLHRLELPAAEDSAFQ
jgi:hypothetical protein